MGVNVGKQWETNKLKQKQLNKTKNIKINELFQIAHRKNIQTQQKQKCKSQCNRIHASINFGRRDELRKCAKKKIAMANKKRLVIG